MVVVGAPTPPPRIERGVKILVALHIQSKHKSTQPYVLDVLDSVAGLARSSNVDMGAVVM